MKKKPLTTDKKDRLNAMKDTRNYAAGSEGEDILDREDEDEEIEEPLPGDLELLEEEDDDDDDDRA